MVKWRCYFLIESTIFIISSFLYFYSFSHPKILVETFAFKFLIYCGIGLFFLINIISTFIMQDNLKFDKFNNIFSFLKYLLKDYRHFYIKYYYDALLMNLLVLRTIGSIIAGYGSLSLFIMDSAFNYSAFFSLLPIYLCILLLIIPERILLLMKIFYFLPVRKPKSTQSTERFSLMYLHYSKLDRYSEKCWIISFMLLAAIAFILASFSKLFSLKILFSLTFCILLEISIYPKIIKEVNKIIDFFNISNNRMFKDLS